MLTKEQIDLIKSLHAQGVSMYAIAKQIGCSQPAVRYHLSLDYRRSTRERAKARSERKPYAPKRPITEAIVQEAAKLRANGLSYAAIATQLQVHARSIQYRLDKEYRNTAKERALASIRKRLDGETEEQAAERKQNQAEHSAKHYASIKRREARALISRIPAAMSIVAQLLDEFTALSPDAEYAIRFTPPHPGAANLLEENVRSVEKPAPRRVDPEAVRRERIERRQDRPLAKRRKADPSFANAEEVARLGPRMVAANRIAARFNAHGG